MMLKRIEIRNFKGLESIVLDNCAQMNAIVGKNNSGKSSILHAIDMAGLALSVNNWNRFQPKLAIKDLFRDVGDFSITLTYQDDSKITINATPQYGPRRTPAPGEEQKFKSILIWPDVAVGMKPRGHKTPKNIIANVENRNFSDVDSLDILYAMKFYALRGERGLTHEAYKRLLEEIRFYFPEIEDVDSSRTEDDIATLTYTEYGRQLDILYSGSGLKHFIDILLKTTVSGANIVLLDEPEMGLHPDLQRRFIGYLRRMAEEKQIQIFMATHSQVLLNYADTLSYYRVTNSKGRRSVISVPNEAIHTLLSDMGLRPSDVFNQDICLLVEGASEVVYFEHILHELYADDFAKIAVGVIQYGGSAADGIISGDISTANIVPAQKYTFWIRDRDSKPDELPSTDSNKFKNALERHGLKCHIWRKREIEYYYPETVLVKAQQGDQEKENHVRQILSGDQGVKFRSAAEAHGVCIPKGKYLRGLLRDHLNSKEELDTEVRELIEQTLIPWRDEILGDATSPNRDAEKDK